MTDTQVMYAVLLPVTALAGFVRGFAGFGGPLLLLPVISALIGPAPAIWVVMWIDLAVVLSLLPGALSDAPRRLVLPLTIGSFATLPIGVWALTITEPGLMRRLICLAIIAACLVLLSGWRPRSEIGWRGLTAAGALTGLVIGATSIAVTAALFLQAAARTAAEARASFIVWCLPQNVLLLSLIAWKTAAPAGQLSTILALLPVYVATALIGARMHGLVSDATSRRLAITLALVIAVVGLTR